ncbi:MAG: hypothetical protein IH598_04270 [Bacteroidales bacterium]|nr:hypothetical protein [Bacteroidales bacterium]
MNPLRLLHANFITNNKVVKSFLIAICLKPTCSLKYTREQEVNYGLAFNYTVSEQDQKRAIAKGLEPITTPGFKEQWQQKKEKMLKEKIDVTVWLVDFVEKFYN